MIQTIRQSMLNLFGNCQIAFRHRYVEGEIMPPGIAARVGSGLHKAAEANHRQKMNSGMDMPISEMQEIASDEYAHLINSEGVYFPGTAQELHVELGKGEDLTVALTANYGSLIAPQITPVGAEVTIHASHPALPIPFSGTLDVIDARGIIFDLKTASKKWRCGKENETTQPTLYKYMAQQTFYKTYEFGFHVLAYGGETQYIPTESGLPGMERIVGIAKAILNACETGCFMPAVPGHWMCSEKWCGWYHSCLERL